MALSRIVVAGLLALAISPSSYSATVEEFGLVHSTVGGATLASNLYGRGFAVENLNIFGDGGISTDLGQADSGAFIYPYTGGVSDGYFMRGRAYGLVNGQSNSVIGTVSGYRSGYATFFVTADYSALGAESLTFQLWNSGTLVAEATGPAGEVQIYSESFPSPRANPWWRQTNGDYGASIEMRFPVVMTIPSCDGPSCPTVYADRIFIRPNGATSVVEYVSRTDVFGGGGLPNFNYDSMRLGMFNRAHAALGEVKLVATNHTLTMAAIPPGSEEGGGVLAEFDSADRAEIALQPIPLATFETNGPQAWVEIGASGTLLHSFGYVGAITLVNSNGVLGLSAYLFAEPDAKLQVWSNSVLVGAHALATYENVRIDGAPRIAFAGANADSLAAPAGLSVGFDTNATLTFSNGIQLVGNRVRVQANQYLGLADITGVSMVAHDLSSFTILGESSTGVVPPRLGIARDGGNVTLRWSDPAQAYQLEYATVLNTYFSQVQVPVAHTNETTTVSFSLAESEVAFFRLGRYSYQYGD